MANLKNVKINSNTVIDVDGNLHLLGQSSLKDKDGSNIINYNGYWIKPSIVHPGNGLDIDISSPQNSSLDIKNSAEGSASLKVNGVEIVNTNSIVKASTIEDKFLRNDQDDDTIGALTAQKFITIPVTTEYQNSMILFRESEFRIESDLTEQTFLNIVNNQACAGLKVNNTEIVNPETSKVIADAIEDKFLRNDGNDSTSGSLTATKYVSNIAVGTSPYACTSTTKNDNLNADCVDSVHVASLSNGKLVRYNSTGTQLETGTVAESSGALSSITTLSMSGRLTNTLATGTSPFLITSTTVNANLNADLLDGNHASAFSLTSHNHYGLYAELNSNVVFGSIQGVHKSNDGSEGATLSRRVRGVDAGGNEMGWYDEVFKDGLIISSTYGE